MRVITSKDKGKVCKLKHKQPCQCGEGVFLRLPLYVCEKLTCQCEVDYREAFEWMTSVGIKTGGSFCTLCGKPRRFSIVNYFFVCEGCENYFTYDFRKFPKVEWGKWIRWPLPNLLCEKCDIDVPVPLFRRRRTRVVFD